MHALRLTETKSVPVKYIRARCGVRYWEDATVNGEEDTDGSRIPLREGTAADNDDLGGGNWLLTIDLDTGKIEGWPEGTTASVHYKVCDDGDYELLDADRNVVASIDGYVPSLMCPEGEGYGDYVIMEIAADGTIAKWKADLSEFEKSGDHLVDRLRGRISDLERALRLVLVGGNHCALLIGADHPPANASHETARRHYAGRQDAYHDGPRCFG